MLVSINCQIYFIYLNQNRIKDRAYALKEARESNRKGFIDACYTRQWRDACDDARTLDSKQMTKYMQSERIRQIEEKKARKEALSAQEDSFLDESKKQLDAVEERARAKSEMQRLADLKNKQDLREQVCLYVFVYVCT